MVQIMACSDTDVHPNRRQAIILTNHDPIYWRKYASPNRILLIVPFF